MEDKNMRGAKVLLIEDEKGMAQNVTDRLGWLGCKIQVANTGDAGLAALRADRPDLIILDIQLRTEEEGFDVLRELRGDILNRTIPVIVYSITANQLENRLRGFGLGAMWCLAKGAGLTELEAVVRVALEFIEEQRRTPFEPGGMPLYFDNDSGTIWIDGQERPDIKLNSNLQRKLLALLFERRGSICSRDDIATYVYGEDVEDISDEQIDRLVSRLRAKLGDDPQKPRFIKTERDMGYKLLVGALEE